MTGCGRVRRREESSAQSLEVERLNVRKTVRLERALEERRQRRRVDVALRDLKVVRAVRPQQRFVGLRKGVGVGAPDVPEEGHPTARPEDALKLGAGPGTIEPVERLARRDEIDRPIGQCRRFRAAAHAADVRLAGQQFIGGGAHRVVWLDGDHGPSRAQQKRRRNAGSRADVCDDIAGRKGDTGFECLEKGIRIARAEPHVVADAVREAPRRVDGVFGHVRRDIDRVHIQ
jgi:hypothetical protein